LNRELVSKPYTYIDKIRDALDKEQKEIVTTIKANNEKYVNKIGQCDHKISKVLTDTETLLAEYRKRVSAVGKNLESIRKLREDLMVRTDKLESGMIKINKNCKDNTKDLHDHIDRISLKYQEDLVDLKSSSEGFARELERVQILFRELQTEFLVTLEEKRTHNEQLLHGVKLRQLEIDASRHTAKQVSDKSLATLLPIL